MIRYSGRIFTEEEMILIRKIIKENPELSRSALSRKICASLNWRKPDGGLKDMRCRVVMLKMHADNLIKLPEKRFSFPASKPIEHTKRTDPRSEITCRVDLLFDLKLIVVDKKTTSLWNEYIDRYHYLGFQRLPGAQLRYIAYVNENPVACLGFGAAAWKTASRDSFIGWTEDERKRNLHLVVNNARFLIMPWVKSKNLASKLLASVSKRLPDDWNQRYKYKPVLLETFVETQRFNGTCYKAANWIHVGKTQGRGRNDRYHKNNSPIKDIFVIHLDKKFKKILTN